MTGLASLVMLVAGAGLFMVAALVVCIAFMIFSDIINLGGSFDGIGEKAIAAIFAPLLVITKPLDVIMQLFAPTEIKDSLRTTVVAK